MQRVIIGLAQDDVAPDRQMVPEHLEGDYPAIEREERTYLDGKSVYFGTAVSRVDTEETDIHVDEDGIHTEQVEGRKTVLTEFITDPSEGWVGVDSGDGDWFFNTLMGVWGSFINRATLDVTAFANHVDDQGGKCWQVGYRRDLDEDDNEVANVGTLFHNDAHFGAGAGRYNQFGYAYHWDDAFMRGTVAKSGYVAEFNTDRPETFARWLKEEVLPFCTLDENAKQTTLSEVEA